MGAIEFFHSVWIMISPKFVLMSIEIKVGMVEFLTIGIIIV